MKSFHNLDFHNIQNFKALRIYVFLIQLFLQTGNKILHIFVETFICAGCKNIIYLRAQMEKLKLKNVGRNSILEGQIQSVMTFDVDTSQWT